MIGKKNERKVDAIVLSPSDSNKLVPSLEEAYENKIPVIIIDSEVNTDKIKSIIATDNLEAGKKAGSLVIDRIGEK